MARVKPARTRPSNRSSGGLQVEPAPDSGGLPFGSPRAFTVNGTQGKKAEPAPVALGYRMPAEWEPHAATWLAWPHEKTDWPGKFVPIPWVYADIVRHLSQVGRVRVLG